MDIWARAPAPLGLCPHPEKKKFPDQINAIRKILRQSEPQRFGIYHCRCGWWHLFTRKNHGSTNS